ncbi:MAG: sugar ABC transporter permease [Dictyoglomaceae bacterium]|nr:sugar ABC transporter permease [Dictyoglomaceae bacterium]
MTNKHLYTILFLLPVAIFYIILVFYPVFFSIYVSFKDWNMLKSPWNSPFVGLSNYKKVFSDDIFIKAFSNTLIFSISIILIGIPLSLAIAVLLTKVKNNAIWRYIIFIPAIAPPIAIGMTWMFLFDPTYGIINLFLNFLGLPELEWLASPKHAIFAVIIVGIWSSLGLNTLIFYAGLKDIPHIYYESAKIDGANTWKTFINITLPLLKPVTLFILITNIISSWQVFDLVIGLTGQKLATPGGPANSTQVVVLYMYQTAFRYLEMGKASAMAFILFSILFAFSCISLLSMYRGGFENV